jgi:ABC-2 type transport system ATP-binding protein
MEAVFQDCIREEAANGRTVLLSSHILAEAEALCDRVSIIRAGRTVQSGTLAELRHLTRTHIEAVLTGPVPATLSGHPGVHDLRITDHRLTLDVDAAELGAVLGTLSSAGVTSLLSAPPTLEEIFLRHYTVDSVA